MTPSAQLNAFLAKYTPAIRSQAKAAIATMRKRLPHAVEFVYDNYNALVIGYGPNERPSDALFSIALYPRYVNLFFLQGASLADPEKLLRGSGNQVRRIRLEDASVLDRQAVRALMAQAVKSSDVPMDPKRRRKLLIRAISAKHRPRRP